MKKIKFSHDYLKFATKVCSAYPRAKLLQAIKIHFNDLSKCFVNYDTLFDGGNYELPHTNLILLILITDWRQDVFTTIRRFTPEKWRYYKKSEGEWFNLVSPSTIV